MSQISPVEGTVMQEPGLKKGALNNIFLLVIFGCSLISPAMCIGGLMPYLADRTGWAMAGSMVIAGLLNFFWAASYSDMIQIYPKCGSHYTYIRNSLGPAIGFFIGAGVLPVYIFSSPVYVFVWSMQTVVNCPFWIIAVIYVAVVCLLSIRGIALASIVAAMMFITESCIVIALSLNAIGVTWPRFTELFPSFLFPHHPFTFGSLMFASVLSVYNYIGFASITSLVEESSPKLISRAINWTLLIVTSVYLIGLIGLPLVWASHTDIAASQTPFIDAAMILWDKYWPIGFLAVLLSTFTCSLACINTGARMLYDMSRDGVVPKWLGKIHPSYKTPWSALAFIAIIYVACALTIPYVVICELVVLVILLAYTGVALSNLKANKNVKGFGGIIKSRVAPTLGIILALYLMVTASRIGWIYTLCWFVVVTLYELYIYKTKPESLRKMDLSEM